MIFEILPKFSIKYEKSTGVISFCENVYETYLEIPNSSRKDVLDCLLSIETFKNTFKTLNSLSLFEITERDLNYIISQPDPVRDSSVEAIVNYYETLCKLIKIPEFYDFIKSDQILLSKFAFSDGFLRGLLDKLDSTGFKLELDYKKPLFDYEPVKSREICSDLNNLKQLIVTPSPSGFETDCQRVFEKIVESYGGRRFYSDHIGNVAYSFGNAKGKRILLSAHIDELGFQVLDITDEGFLIITSLGGIDMKVTQAASVMVAGKNGWFSGVIGKKPIHAETKEDRGNVSEIEEIRVDLGLTKDELEASGIEIGSVVVYTRPTDTDKLNLWLGKNICSPGLDDKAGIYVILEIAKRLRDINTDYEIIIASCVQEELGLRGATVLAQNIKPDISIDIDVTPSSDFGVKPEIWGNMKLGEGPIIELGPGNSPRLWKLFIEQARESNIKFQRVVGGPGGTNTDVFQRFGNCETQLISLPIRNLHTPTESCSMHDLSGAVDIITEIIKGGKL